MKVLSILCYIFAALDFGLFYLADIDLTGVFWSPYAACALGYFFSWLGGKNSGAADEDAEQPVAKNRVASEDAEVFDCLPEGCEVELKAEHAITSTYDLSPELQLGYFLEILQTEFPEYKIKMNVPVTKLVGEVAEPFKLYPTRPYQVYKAEWGKPYTYALYKEGKLAGVLMLSPDSEYNKVGYLISRMYAKKLNVPYISFYHYRPNHVRYVVYRIKQMLG